MRQCRRVETMIGRQRIALLHPIEGALRQRGLDAEHRLGRRRRRSRVVAGKREDLRDMSDIGAPQVFARRILRQIIVAPRQPHAAFIEHDDGPRRVARVLADAHIEERRDTGSVKLCDKRRQIVARRQRPDAVEFRRQRCETKAFDTRRVEAGRVIVADLARCRRGMRRRLVEDGAKLPQHPFGHQIIDAPRSLIRRYRIPRKPSAAGMLIKIVAR
jgi:hypothetical protein